jgi:hypothetical protein
MRVMKDQRKKDTFFHTAFVLPVSTNICNSKHLIGFGFIDPRHFEASGHCIVCVECLSSR